jgi:hypothetical protein
MDIVERILWFSIFFTPLITIPSAWKYIKKRKIIKLMVGILFSLILSALLLTLTMAIAFRNGLGPT